MSLSYEIERCQGVGYVEDGILGWREGCEHCLRRTSLPNPNAALQKWIDPPKIIVFDCEYIIDPSELPARMNHSSQDHSVQMSTTPVHEVEVKAAFAQIKEALSKIEHTLIQQFADNKGADVTPQVSIPSQDESARLVAPPISTTAKKATKSTVKVSATIPRPTVEAGQIWFTRAGDFVKVGSFDRNEGKFLGSNSVWYSEKGFATPGRFSRLDLLQLIGEDQVLAKAWNRAGYRSEEGVLRDSAGQAESQAEPKPEPKPQSEPEPEPSPEPQPLASGYAVMVEDFTARSEYMLGRALAQYGNITESRAKALLNGNLPIEVKSFVSRIHAEECLRGVARVKGVKASIVEIQPFQHVVDAVAPWDDPLS